MIVLLVRDKMKRLMRFTASWCQPCKMMAKNLDSIVTNIPIEIVDIDEKTDIAIEYGIRSVPTLIMLDENTEVKRCVGAKTTQELEKWLND
jgi:thioredoxin 1